MQLKKTRQGPTRNVREKDRLAPRTPLDRIIFTYNGAKENEQWFEEYLEIRGVIFDPKYKYVAMCNDAGEYTNVRNETSRLELNILQVIPQRGQEEKDLPFLPLNDQTAFQYNKGGWIYRYIEIYTNGAVESLYVGRTDDPFPLRRATAHLNDRGKTEFEIYLQTPPHSDRVRMIQLLQPDAYERLIRLSYLLPFEQDDPEAVRGYEEAYREKRLSAHWVLERTEWTLIHICRPTFNKQGQRQTWSEIREGSILIDKKLACQLQTGRPSISRAR